MSGRPDPEHLTYAIRAGRVVLTQYGDFERLHFLLWRQGYHPGILLVRRDNDPRRNMKPHDVVRFAALKPLGSRFRTPACR